MARIDVVSKPVPCIEPIAMASKPNVPTTALHVAASKGNPNLVLLKWLPAFQLKIVIHVQGSKKNLADLCRHFTKTVSV